MRGSYPVPREVPAGIHFHGARLSLNANFCLRQKKGSVMEFRLDHFKLYEIQPYSTPGSPYLKGQFDAMERPFALGQLQQFANPVSKNGEGIKNRNHHLTAYDIAATRPDPPRQVFLENQFGRQEIRIG